MKVILFAVICSALLASVDVSAMDYVSYQKMLSDKNPDVRYAAKLYVRGVYNGLTLANEMLERQKQPKLFCLPETVKLEDNNLYRFVDGGYKDDVARGMAGEKIDVETEMLLALESTYLRPDPETTPLSWCRPAVTRCRACPGSFPRTP